MELAVCRPSSVDPQDASDEDLLLAYHNTGDEGVFTELVHRYKSELYNYLRQYLKDQTLAEDAFQETFLQLHLKCGSFTPGRKVRPWLYSIATNKAIDLVRKQKRHSLWSIDHLHSTGGDEDAIADVLEYYPVERREGLYHLLAENVPAVADHQSPSCVLAQRQDCDALVDAVLKLDTIFRVVIQLRYMREMPYREIGEALAIPVGTVKSRLHAAVGKLRKAFGVVLHT
ncbi:RNA polymerase subunit sigma-70 [Candidatus Peregrinibacteria bacterium CG10_big_fil_rev_8_21_14_0_10_55_24]|nr:MAG: RNA polymerase subunit sigma-70 [Candidatus Peregrinibacteria bacterium CG10_big_fil_rev_8_21_14_0_10_55_24]